MMRCYNTWQKAECWGLWTYHEIKGIGKGNDDGMWRRKKKKRSTKEKWMDEIQERTGMNLANLRDATMERKQWRRYIMLIARAYSEGCDNGKKAVEEVHHVDR